MFESRSNVRGALEKSCNSTLLRTNRVLHIAIFCKSFAGTYLNVYGKMTILIIVTLNEGYDGIVKSASCYEVFLQNTFYNAFISLCTCFIDFFRAK